MRIRQRCLVGYLSFLLAIGMPAAVQATPGKLPAAVAKKINGDVKKALLRFGVPGAAIMVVQNGRPVLVRAFGLRDNARNLPVRPATLFEIGSITKQFTAASILQLQEAGKLQIDRRLSDYLPNAPHAREVTLRQLLTHTAGLHDYFDRPPAEMDRLASHQISYKNLIARIAPLPLDFPPGSQWSYSNTGYQMLGKVIEKVSGESYRTYLQRHILDPLDMKETYTTGDVAHLSNLAAGYRHANGKLKRAPFVNPGWGYAAGFLVTNLSNLAKWDAALRGGKVVSPSDYRQMKTAVATTKNGTSNYGLGLFVDSVYDQPRIGHTGGTLGSTTADELFPRQRVRIIAFTNLGDDTPEAGETLTNIIFADLYPDIAAQAQKPAPGENGAITQVVRDAFGELQADTRYSRFDARLRHKLAGGAGARLASGIGPYGPPTAAVFKGVRRQAKDIWYEYAMQFGPGVSIPFAVTVGADRAVAKFSIG